MDLKKAFNDASAPVPWILFLVAAIFVIVGLYTSGYSMQAWVAVFEVIIVFIISVVLTVYYRRKERELQKSI